MFQRKIELQRKAACALNLCTVSVSQIIDYDDINILEQEYEAILNNLNLKQIPKDQALLDILKQLLDTITFFRIQEGDKRFIEKDYQQKMKDAIWSAVPNFGVIVAGGLNPASIAISLASQIGIGYMNYRKQKANNQSEKEKQMWQLQRSAIEQFNGLRRELFTTAWRLAEKYDFPDEWRLTENQIKQYNSILMDHDLLRKYERLDSIKDNFKAYPPFWYEFGSTANSLAIEYQNDAIRFDFYSKKALSHFQTFHRDYIPLMREDLIASSCELEYADCLIMKNPNWENKKGEVLECILRAYRFAGKSLDVIQQCAFLFMRIDEASRAEPLLRRLINEDYNKILNAQILSRIYVESKNKTEYDTLALRVNAKYLLPYGEYPAEIFLKNQQDILIQKTELILDQFKSKYEICFNKTIPLPSDKEHPDAFFIQDSDSERRTLIDSAFLIENRKHEYINILTNSSFYYDGFETINQMIQSASELNIGDMDTLSDSIIKKITQKKFTDVLKAIQSNPTQKELNDYQDLFNFSSFTSDFFHEFSKCIKVQISRCRDMRELIKLDSSIRTWCIDQKIPEPEVLLDEEYHRNDGCVEKYFIDPISIFGQNFKEHEKKAELKKELKKCIESFGSSKSVFSDANFLYLDEDLDTYFADKKKNPIDQGSMISRSDILAVLDMPDSSFPLFVGGDDDIYISTKGIYLKKKHKIIPYVGSEPDYLRIEDKKIYMGSERLSPKNTDINKLYSFINQLRNIIIQDCEKDKRRK